MILSGTLYQRQYEVEQADSHFKPRYRFHVTFSGLHDNTKEYMLSEAEITIETNDLDIAQLFAEWHPHKVTLTLEDEG